MFHRWIGTDEDPHEVCLTCGGMWVWDSYAGRHVGIDGTPAVNCTRNTAQCHHYAGECPAEECNLDSNCNCLHCYS